MSILVSMVAAAALAEWTLVSDQSTDLAEGVTPAIHLSHDRTERALLIPVHRGANHRRDGDAAAEGECSCEGTRQGRGGGRHAHGDGGGGRRGGRGGAVAEPTGFDLEQPERSLAMMSRQLGLTEDQQDRIRALMIPATETLDTHRKTLRSARQNLSELDPAAVDYVAQRDMLVSSAADAFKANLMVTSETRNQISAVLTSDQKHRLDELSTSEHTH